MSKPYKKIDRDEYEIFLISAIKSCTEVMIESDMYIKSAKESDSMIVESLKDLHEKRKAVARKALQGWIEDYLEEYF